MAVEPLPPSLEDPADRLRLMLPEVLEAIRDPRSASPGLLAELAAIAGEEPSLGRRLRLAGRARKVSVSMPEDLTTAVQRRVGRGEFSQYVTEAVARQLELDLIGELSDLLSSEYGPVPADALDEARASWPDGR
ncbi:hypothetical protein O7623_30630 [Solwaraspora sp. WMMD791]|uniref:hypothetical protein n=1 Tax=Solwaraspora sp. WMMD791 TaxID=3016086 RepID=UPI00249BE9E1|nr:hypothetical protein [Solwaraspora sp. WMMD791]WFE27521.1 hypothetical protein O7623_30630 [Solwaraspora sp. WMMD791]